MTDKNTVKAIVSGIAFPLFIVAVVLVAAGTEAYWQGWVYGASNLLLLAMNLVLLRGHPDLMDERLSPGQGTKWWDKLYFAFTTPLYLISIIFAAVDVGRLHWSPVLPAWAYIASWAVYLAGQAVHFWAKGTNRWFATVVRIQKDRGQTVCDQGPYRIVRHPGYVGGILFMVTTPLILAVIPQAVAAILLVGRTFLEDATLQAELPGYAEYARRIRHRLLPLG
jgi:protein-S-isoprenylcysteine O-methyltransferase Ste14